MKIKNTGDESYWKGVSLFEQGKWDEAVDHFDQALEFYRLWGHRSDMDHALYYLDQVWRRLS